MCVSRGVARRCAPSCVLCCACCCVGLSLLSLSLSLSLFLTPSTLFTLLMSTVGADVSPCFFRLSCSCFAARLKWRTAQRRGHQ